MVYFLAATSPCMALGPAEANVCKDKRGKNKNNCRLASVAFPRELCVEAEAKTLLHVSTAGLVRVDVEAHCGYVSALDRLTSSLVDPRLRLDI